MQTVRMNFLYRQGNTLFFMDPSSFEQVELDASLAPGKSAHYLIENSSTALVRDAENFVKLILPDKAVCTVESTSPARVKVNDAGGKDAKLTNGLTILVPNYIENGQHIIVNTSNDLFVGKSDTPPMPEEEKTFN
jgi:elongation factor P